MREFASGSDFGPFAQAIQVKGTIAGLPALCQMDGGRLIKVFAERVGSMSEVRPRRRIHHRMKTSKSCSWLVCEPGAGHRLKIIPNAFGERARKPSLGSAYRPTRAYLRIIGIAEQQFASI